MASTRNALLLLSPEDHLTSVAASLRTQFFLMYKNPGWLTQLIRESYVVFCAQCFSYFCTLYHFPFQLFTFIVIAMTIILVVYSLFAHQAIYLYNHIPLLTVINRNYDRLDELCFFSLF